MIKLQLVQFKYEFNLNSLFMEINICKSQLNDLIGTGHNEY